MSFRLFCRPVLLMAMAAMTLAATCVNAQTLHVDVPITGVIHTSAPGFVEDFLNAGPTTPATMDLTKYKTFEVQFHAPAGMQVVVTHDSTGGFLGTLEGSQGGYPITTGTVSLSSTGLSGAAPGVSSTEVEAGGTGHGFVSAINGSITTPFSFTSYTVTTSNIGASILSGPAETFEAFGALFLYPNPNASAPGQFVFLQPFTTWRKLPIIIRRASSAITD